MSKYIGDPMSDFIQEGLLRVASQAGAQMSVCNGVNAVMTPTEPFANPSGIIPLDLRILVLPDPVETKTAGGIILIEPEVEKKQYAQCKATLIAVGENAWEEAASRSPAFVKPKPGDRVLIAKYGGILIKGADGEDYRIMNDEDCVARLEE